MRWIVLALGLSLTSVAAAVCPDEWPSTQVVGSLEQLVGHVVEGSVFDVLDFRGEEHILIFDFRSRVEQNLMFDAISTFAESAENRGRIGPGQGMTDYDGHNLHTAALARYFRLAEELSAVLPDPEIRLMRGLRCMGLLLEVDGELVGKPRTAVLAINHDKVLEEARAGIVSHELYHGLDMTDEEHWRRTWEVWDSLRPGQKRTWKKLVLGQRSYDERDADLVVAEVGAYGSMFGLEKILRLRQSRDLSVLTKSEVEEIRRGRSFEGIQDTFAFENGAFLFEMEYGFKAAPQTRSNLDSYLSGDSQVAAVVFPSQLALENALGRVELRRSGGANLSIYEIDGGRLQELLPARTKAALTILPGLLPAEELEQRLGALGKRLPGEEGFKRLLSLFKALTPRPSVAALLDCEICAPPARTAWILYQLELLVAQSNGATLDQARIDWRAMGRAEQSAYEEVLSRLGLELSEKQKVLMARAAELAARRSGLRSGSDLRGLPPGAAEILLAGRRSLDSNHGPRTREPRRNMEAGPGSQP